MTHAKHTKEELAAKLRTLYPEIGVHGIDLGLEFDHEKGEKRFEEIFSIG